MWWEFWHWWRNWEWWIGTYQWLESNNLWKATIAFWITLLLGVALTAVMRPWRAWKRHRETQEKIADRLDTSTPGGITDLVHALRTVLNDLDEGEAPDDNGTDEDPLQRRRKGSSHRGHAEPERNEHVTSHSVIPNVHGGGNAGHR
jgi:hypothetical protein